MFYFYWGAPFFFYFLEITFSYTNEVVIKFSSYYSSSLCLYLRALRGIVKNDWE